MKKSWDTFTSSQVSNCDGVVLKIYFDHNFQWLQEGLNCESFVYKVVADLCWDTSTSSQGSNCDGVVLET